MSWLAGIPIVGDIIKLALVFANKRWGFNKTQQEIEVMAQEVASEANVKDLIVKFWEFVVAYEGSGDALVKSGIVGQVLVFMRSGWRPLLQWGMTISVLKASLFGDIPIMDMKEEIIFIGGLAVMREIAKKINGNLK